MSIDNGLSWSPTKEMPDIGHVRHATASGFGGGALVFSSDKGVLSSLDNGATWRGPDVAPCPGNLFGMASSQSVSVWASARAVCTTLDGGKTWSQQTLGTRIFTNPVWNGSRLRLGRQQGRHWDGIHEP